jgi:hypothetical protein
VPMYLIGTGIDDTTAPAGGNGSNVRVAPGLLNQAQPYHLGGMLKFGANTLYWLWWTYGGGIQLLGGAGQVVP